MHLRNKFKYTGREEQENFKCFQGNLFQNSPTRLPSPLARQGAAGESREPPECGHRFSALPCRASAAAAVAKPQLSPSLQTSPPLRPQTFLNPPSSPLSGPAGRAPAPSLTCASRRGPAGHPPPQPPLHRAQAQEGSFRAQRRDSQAAGGCGRKQGCLHGCCGFSRPHPPGSALCSSSPPIRNSPGRRLRPPCSARTTFGSDAQAEGVQPR